MCKSYLLILILFVFIKVPAFAQDQLGVYFCGMTMHIGGDENAALMPLRLDERGQFVVNVGGAIQYRKQVGDSRWSINAVQTFQADCAYKGSWGTGICLGYDFIKSPEHQLIMAIGPGFFFRKNWAVLDGYLQVPQLKVSKNQKWEYLFVPTVPLFEYTWFPQDCRLGLSSYCIFDPINILGNIGFGVNYRLN